VTNLQLALVALLFFAANPGASATNTSSPGNTALIFTDIGSYLQTQGTIHVAITLDYRFYREHCDYLKRPTNNETASAYTNAATRRYFRTFTRCVTHVCEDVDQLSVHPVPHLTRYPRQIWAAVMAVTSVFSIYEVTRLQRLVNRLQDKQHEQATLLRYTTSRIDLLNNKNNEIAHDLVEILNLEKNITSTVNTISWLQQRIALANEFGTDVNRGYEIMQELRRGRISPLLLGKAEAKKLLARVQAEARLLGGQPIIEHPEDIYQLPVSVVSDTPFLYEILLHVGVTKEPRRLFRYHPSPIVMRQGGQQVALMIEPKRRLLVHSINTHQELDDDDLNACLRRQNTYICPGPTAFHTQLRRSCLGSLFAGDLTSVREHCPLHQTNVSWTAHSIGNDRVAVYFRDKTVLQTICPGDVRRNDVVHGHQVLHLPSNCSLTGLDLRITARMDILLQVPLATHPEWDSAELLDSKTPAEILDIRARLQQRNVNPEPDIARMLRQDAADRREEGDDDHAGGHFYAVYVIVGVLVIMTMTFVWRYGKLYATAARKTYLELRTAKNPSPCT
jgi:hypothetical protein